MTIGNFLQAWECWHGCIYIQDYETADMGDLYDIFDKINKADLEAYDDLVDYLSDNSEVCIDTSFTTTNPKYFLDKAYKDAPVMSFFIYEDGILILYNHGGFKKDES